MSEFQPPPPPPPPSAQPTAAQPLSPSDERLWSTLAHVGNIIWFLPSLLIFLILGPRSARVKDESREALNFVITAAIAWVVLEVLGIVVGIVSSNAPLGIDIVFGLIGGLIAFLQFAVWVLLVVFSIIAAVRVTNGGGFRYPLSLRLIK